MDVLTIMDFIMKKIYYILVLCLFFLFGCKKDGSVCVTNVETIGAEFLDGGEIRINAEVHSVGSPTIDRRGVCYSLKQSPTIDDNVLVEKGKIVGSFSCKIIGLKENTTYYVRAFVQNSFGLVYGDEITFTTLTKPTVETLGTENVSEEGFKVKGRIVANGGGKIKKCGFCYDTNEMPTVEGSHTEADVASDEFSSEINGLSSGQRYYVRAYAQNACGVSYGEQIVVNTNGLAVVKTVGADNISGHGAKCYGKIEYDGGETILEKGICWAITENPNVQGSHVVSTNDEDAFNCFIDELTISTTYYIRAYATNKYGVSYGNQMTITTSGMPIVNTGELSDITPSWATCSGDVLSDGGSYIKDKGICYGSSANPTVSNSFVSAGGDIGHFTCILSGLNSSSVYYVRAYATNEYGTSYGKQITLQTSGKPIVINVEMKNITSATADYIGNVISNGGAEILDRGICYSLTPNPTLSNNRISAGTGSGSFSCSINDLNNNTSYYLRAYAINKYGTAYGDQISFVTGIELPTVITVSTSDVTRTSISCSGEVLLDGGSQITDKGICWGLTNSPTISNNVMSAGMGTGKYTCKIDGLSAGQTYYFRAYARNVSGISYGGVHSAKTLSVTTPIVTTGTISNISASFVTCSGTVVDNGGSYVFDRGICFGIKSEPTINDGKIQMGIDNGDFSNVITNLENGTQYFFRAYAINNVGVSYGDVISIKTKFDICGNECNVIRIGSQTWMAENLRCNKYDTKSSKYGDEVAYVSSNYGYLYAFDDAVVSSQKQGICPNGWHIPSSDEWDALSSYYGGDENIYVGNTAGAYSYLYGNPTAGRKLKSNVGWNGNNSSGFNAMPTGYVYGSSSNISYQGEMTLFWSRSISGTDVSVRLLQNNDYFISTTRSKLYKLSVRCLKD